MMFNSNSVRRALTALLALADYATGTVIQRDSALLPLKYNSLPLGTVKPAGWLLDQLQIQANGLAGHEMDFYDYVANGTWTGGSSTYSNLQEAGSYWFNGLVATAYVLDDARLKNQVQNFLDYVLANQGSDGWLGPEPRLLWGRYPFLLGAMQLAEADPTQTDTIVAAMMKFVTLANSMLNQNGTGLEEWGMARWQDFALVLEWLYDNYPNNQQYMLLETMQILKATGTNWTDVFSPAKFPTGDVGTNSQIQWHGVNVGQALKAEAVGYRFTQSQSDVDSTSLRWTELFQYHGRASGTFAADEYLASMEPNRGSELCQVVETMYSGTYVYQSFGTNAIADRVETLAYNALPGTLTGTMWSRQYLQQQNQIWAKTLNPNVFPTDGSYSNVFGLEPNYPCCTVNHPQGFSKFVSNAFVTTSDGSSLVQVYLGPFSVNTTLAGGNAVQVNVVTNYPFSDVLTATITAAQAYTHYVRIPDWASQSGKGTISINGGASSPIAPNSDSLLPISIAAGTTTYTLTLPADITTAPGLNGAVTVSRGPLNYVLDIPRTQQVLAQNSIQPLAVDLEFDPSGPWQYAIDPSTLVFTTQNVTSLPSPIFDSGLPPVSMTVTGCPIAWTTTSGAADTPPANPACTGPQTNLTLWPYGAAKLRIGEMPTFKSTEWIARAQSSGAIARSTGVFSFATRTAREFWYSPARVLSQWSRICDNGTLATIPRRPVGGVLNHTSYEDKG